jgi:multidrug transporter EmrE-like cation transporter
MTHWILIFVAAAANVVLNLSLKETARGLSFNSAREFLVAMLASPWPWMAGISAVILVGAFMAAIRVFSLSLTYTAVTAIAMVSLTLIGVTMQFETVNVGRAVGLVLIVAGLAVTAWSS